MNKEGIKILLYDLERYIKEPNSQDINGEYNPPMELTQEDAELIVNYVKNLQHQLEEKDKVIDEAIDIIKKEFLCYDNESDEYINGNKLLEILERNKEVK